MIVDFVFGVRPLCASDIDWFTIEYRYWFPRHLESVSITGLASEYADYLAGHGWEMHPEIGVTVRPGGG